MNFRRLSDNDLADFASNVLALLGGTELSAIDTAVRTALTTAIGTLPDDFGQQVRDASNAEGTRMAAVSVKNDSRDQLLAFMSQVRNALLAGVAPKNQYDLCGFDFRDAPVGNYVAQDPTELSAFGYSNGVNTIKYKGNNAPNSVVYEIWRRQGDTGELILHATTKKQSFEDTPVTPGQYYEYKVRAVASKSVSNFSNPAVVYGAG
jgi:hypothetical protein